MKSKTMVYFGYIIKTSLILFAVIAITASSSKRQIYSSNENVNRNVDLSTMALFINKEEEERENAEAYLLHW